MTDTAPRQIRTIADLRPARRNANRGTKRGSDLLDRSITSYGLGRGIVVDKHGQTIAGNHVLEKAAEHGFDVVVVPTDGRTLVVTQRTDLDLEHDQAAVELAYADNRTQQVGFEIDPAVVREDLAAGIDLSGLYFEDELAGILAALEPVADPCDSREAVLRDQFQILITCATEAEQRALLERLISEGRTCRALLS